MNLWASCHFLEARRHAGPQALSKQISCDQIKTITFAKQKVTQGHYKLMKVTACLMFKVVDNKYMCLMFKPKPLQIESHYTISDNTGCYHPDFLCPPRAVEVD